VTATEDPVVGAVKTPAEVIVPADAVKVTAFEKLLVPVTAGVHVVVLPARTGAGAQESDTPVMVGVWMNDTVYVPDLVGS